MPADIEKTLTDLGLTNGEIKVYISLLNLGTVTVGPIIDKAQISSSKVYVILEKLIQKGLVNHITKEKTKHFQAAQPIALMDYVEKKEKEISDIKSSLKDTIKRIEKIQTAKKEYEDARIYRGYKGLKTGMFEAMKSIPDRGNYYFFGIGYEEVEQLNRLFRQITQEAEKRDIIIRGLVHHSQRHLYGNRKRYNMRYTDIEWPSDIGIIGDYVTIIVWKEKEPILYLMHSTSMVQSYLDFFKRMWKTAKK